MYQIQLNTANDAILAGVPPSLVYGNNPSAPAFNPQDQLVAAYCKDMSAQFGTGIFGISGADNTGIRSVVQAGGANFANANPPPAFLQEVRLDHNLNAGATIQGDLSGAANQSLCQAVASPSPPPSPTPPSPPSPPTSPPPPPSPPSPPSPPPPPPSSPPPPTPPRPHPRRRPLHPRPRRALPPHRLGPATPVLRRLTLGSQCRPQPHVVSTSLQHRASP